MKVRVKPTDFGVELGNLYTAGQRVWAVDGSEFGLTLGWAPRTYEGEAGASDRVAVYWPDGAVTWPCTAGILNKSGRWQIAS